VAEHPAAVTLGINRLRDSPDAPTFLVCPVWKPVQFGRSGTVRFEMGDFPKVACVDELWLALVATLTASLLGAGP